MVGVDKASGGGSASTDLLAMLVLWIQSHVVPLESKTRRIPLSVVHLGDVCQQIGR